jgi:hypothetical protein
MMRVFEIINVFHDGVSEIKTVEEIVMKKLKMVADLLAVVDVCIEAFEARACSWNPRARRPHKRRMIMRSTHLTGAIVGTEETADSAVSNPRSRKRRGIFSVPMMWRSGVRFTAPQSMIWKSAKLLGSEEDATLNSASAIEAPMS